jgi:flagellar basal-body rod modification protein FlgD
MNVLGMLSSIVPRAMDSNASSSGSAASGSAPGNTQISQSSFLKLIATELQAQDPTNPLDPSQFMGQLVQFATLNQVTGIYSLLAGGGSATAGNGAANPTGSTAGSSAVQHY